jgi:heme/copper-type cytochrome/quinol oxidase subunit 3
MHLHPQIAEYGATSARRRTLVLIGVMFEIFAAFVAMMFYVRATAADWPIDPPFEFGNLLMVFAMAMAAICGSITMVVGGHSAAKGKGEEAVRWIAIAISSWLVFLFLECVEWANLVFLVDLGPKTPFSATFLLLTGTHWLAVIACIIWFTFAIADTGRRDILAAALYSHFLALWWIVLVIVLYFPNLSPLVDL